MDRKRWPVLLSGAILGSLIWAWNRADGEPEPSPPRPAQSPPAGMLLPQYNDLGELKRPTGFERWIVVGTSIGLSYSADEKKDPANPGQFHNVYLQPQAFDHYVETGEFPEQTVFVVTNNPSEATKGKDDLNRHGFFAAPTRGLEVAVKDSRRFDGGWGYYMYHETADSQLGKDAESSLELAPTAEKPFPQRDCFDCHSEHGAIDNVFTQFYSVLTTARQKHLQRKSRSGKQ